MANFFVDLGILLHAVGGIVVFIFGQWAWERYFSKNSRITVADCGHIQRECKSIIMKEIAEFEHKIDSSIGAGDDNFRSLANRLERTNTLLEAMIGVQLEICRSIREIDCEDLTKILIKHGIEAVALKMRAQP